MKTILFLLILTFSLLVNAQIAVREVKIRTLLSEFEYQYEGKSRNVALKIYMPEFKEGRKAPVILLSHGLGGSRENGGYLGQEWAENGFVVVAMQHAGSDRSIIEGGGKRRLIETMKKAANMENYLSRVHDVPATIDQLTKWSSVPSHVFFKKLNLQQIGMSGHSFGAITTQATSGRSHPGVGDAYTDKRIKAAFAMSPSGVYHKATDAANAAANKGAFGKVRIPWLLMTGTEDKSLMSPAVTVEVRKAVYKALPAGGKYQLVLKGAKHLAFSDGVRLGIKRNPEHHVAIKRISTAFFNAYLKGSSRDKAWLGSTALREVLSKGDTWERK